MAKKEVRILFNQEIVDKYRDYYFKTFPKRKKFDVKPTALSLNQFTAMLRMIQAGEKIKYHDFAMWVLDYYKIPKLKLKNCTLTILFIWHDNRRRDYDNYCITNKFYGDAFTEYGLLEDDSFKQIRSVTTTMEYIKGKHPSVEFIFEYEDELN